MTTELQSGPALISTELATAAAARTRKVIDDLIDLILRLQVATRTTMPALTAGFAPLTLRAHQFLGLQTGLRPPLRP